jgi:hypothetical protein
MLLFLIETVPLVTREEELAVYLYKADAALVLQLLGQFEQQIKRQVYKGTLRVTVPGVRSSQARKSL